MVRVYVHDPDIAPLTRITAVPKSTRGGDVHGASKEERQSVEEAAIPDITTAAPPPSVTNDADAVSVEEQASWTTDSVSDISGDDADPGWSCIN